MILWTRLWFGDERGYNATQTYQPYRNTGCGLVMKEDITQRNIAHTYNGFSCGLVMKEDITQPASIALQSAIGCGLVMKEDITQRETLNGYEDAVVVW